MWGKKVNGKCVYAKRNKFFFFWKIAVQTISRICVLNHRHCFGLIGWLCFSFDKLYIWLEMMISMVVFKFKRVPGKMKKFHGKFKPGYKWKPICEKALTATVVPILVSSSDKSCLTPRSCYIHVPLQTGGCLTSTTAAAFPWDGKPSCGNFTAPFQVTSTTAWLW